MSVAISVKENIRMLEESVRSFIKGTGGVAHARKSRFVEPGFDMHVFKTMCEMGWTGLLVPEDKGGSGLGMQETVCLVRHLGAALSPEPLIQSMVAATLLEDGLVGEVLTGQKLYLFAWQEFVNSLNGAEVAKTTFVNGKLNGRKVFVPYAKAADALVVTTREGAVRVNTSAVGVGVESHPTQDGGTFCNVAFDNVDATLLALVNDSHLALVEEQTTLATAAYLLGVASQAFDIALEYLSIRKQFNVPIGSFQALQHRMSDLELLILLSEACVNNAAMVVDSGSDLKAKQTAVSRAKARCSDTALLVTRQAIQLHGAIGYTDECDIGLYLRKAMTWANLYGSATAHRERFSALTAEFSN